MKTDVQFQQNLEDTLCGFLPQISFDGAIEKLFVYDFHDFDRIFEIGKISVENETYQRLPVFSGENCVAILMIWGIDNTTAIHDHHNYDGKIKILKGNLTEVSYRENLNFIEYDGAGTAYENQIFPEELGGIHSIVNNSDNVSVSLHIYRTSKLDLNGVRIFDTENRKIAWLNENATSCSWHLSLNSYERVVQL